MDTIEIETNLAIRLRERAARENISLETLLARWLADDEVWRETAVAHHAPLLQQVSDAIIATDLQMRIITWNKAAEKIYGWTKAEAIGQEIDQLLQTEWTGEPQALARDTLLQTGLWQGEIRQRTKTGKDLFIWASVTLTSDNQGNIIGGVTVNRDMTERHRAEEALKEERQLFMGGPTVVFKWLRGEGWPVAYVSPNIWEQFGYTQADFMTGKILYKDIVHPDDVERIQAESLRYTAQGVTHFEQEYRIRHANGRYCWLYDFTYVVLNENGDIKYHQGYVQDVTSRKQAETMLQLQHTALESTASAIVITDQQSIVQWSNPAFTRLTGYTAEEALGLSLAKLVRAQDQPAHEAMRQAMQSGQSWHGRLVNKRKDGSRYTEEQTITPVCDHSGKITHFVSIKQDVTEEERAEKTRLEQERLRATLKKEQEFNARLQKAISSLSHDVRTPLTVIWTAKDLLSKYFDRLDEEKRLQQLESIDRQLRYVLELVDDLMLVMKGSLQQNVFKPSLINPAALCQASVNEIQETIGYNHHLRFVTDGCIQKAWADETLISRILLNLLSNAVKFSPEESEVRLELCQREDWLVLRVIDQGMGIAEADQPYIFEPFYRSPDALSVGGTGLGLDIVRACVERHKGNIFVSSAVGQGATFTVELRLENGVGGNAALVNGRSPQP
jgi:PAS domain S-box-containing protein